MGRGSLGCRRGFEGRWRGEGGEVLGDCVVGCGAGEAQEFLKRRCRKAELWRKKRVVRGRHWRRRMLRFSGRMISRWGLPHETCIGIPQVYDISILVGGILI